MVRRIGVVVAVVGEFPFDFSREPGGRREGKIARFLGLVQLAGIDHREGGTDVQLVDGVKVEAGFEALEEGVALGVGEEAVGGGEGNLA